MAVYTNSTKWIEALKELYGGGEVNPFDPNGSELEKAFYEDHKALHNKNLLADLVYKENPFLKMVDKQPDSTGSYVPVLLKTEK